MNVRFNENRWVVVVLRIANNLQLSVLVGRADVQDGRKVVVLRQACQIIVNFVEGVELIVRESIFASFFRLLLVDPAKTTDQVVKWFIKAK